MRIMIYISEDRTHWQMPHIHRSGYRQGGKFKNRGAWRCYQFC